MDSYTKLGALVNDTFTVTGVGNYTFKMWSVEEKKMLTSETWQQGYQKKYQVDTNKGKLDLSQSQMGTLLEGVQRNGKADIVGRTFAVKSNGKSGLDIRYYLNPVAAPTGGLDPALKQKLDAQADKPLYPAQPSVELPPALDPDEEIDLSDLPF